MENDYTYISGKMQPKIVVENMKQLSENFLYLVGVPSDYQRRQAAGRERRFGDEAHIKYNSSYVALKLYL